MTDATFAPGALESLKTYYWRVDETVTDGTVKAGPVWSFTTFLSVDDFESYNDEQGKGTCIYEVWVDGYTNGLSGSIVGNAQAPFAEQKIIHDGKQSMPLEYNNVKSPFYSEAEREFSPVQDWTAASVTTLTLYFRGSSANSPTKLYVTIQDKSGKSGTVTYATPSHLTLGAWTRWEIPVSEFKAAGVNLAAVKKMIIGVGDPDEWDDQPHAPSAAAGWYKTYLSTPPIDISGAKAGTVELTFDSSWRPQFDDNYHQTANATVSFDGAKAEEIFRWESDTASPKFKADATNETVKFKIDNPAGAKTMVLTFGLFDAGNDWSWAIDNIMVTAQPK